MNIKVIGAGCEHCDKLYSNVLDAVKEVGCEAEIEKVEDLIEIVKLGVMTAPSLMVDGKLVISGRVAKKEEIIKFIKQYQDAICKDGFSLKEHIEKFQCICMDKEILHGFIKSNMVIYSRPDIGNEMA